MNNYFYWVLYWVLGGFLIGFGLRGILEYYKNKNVKGYTSLFVKRPQSTGAKK